MKNVRKQVNNPEDHELIMSRMSDGVNFRVFMLFTRSIEPSVKRTLEYLEEVVRERLS